MFQQLLRCKYIGTGAYIKFYLMEKDKNHRYPGGSSYIVDHIQFFCLLYSNRVSTNLFFPVFSTTDTPADYSSDQAFGGSIKQAAHAIASTHVSNSLSRPLITLVFTTEQQKRQDYTTAIFTLKLLAYTRIPPGKTMNPTNLALISSTSPE